MTAVAVTTSCLALVTIVSMTLMAITGCSLSNALFDTCSAFGLGGYSVGVASASSPAVLYILAATMFIGRLGPLTIAYAISRPRNVEPVRYHRADRGRLSGFVDTVLYPQLPILESGTEHRKVREQSWLTTPEAFL